MENTKEKAIEVVKNIYKHANGYVGSSMLSNTEFPDEKMSHAKEIARDVIRHTLEAINDFEIRSNDVVTAMRFYNDVLVSIDFVVESDLN